ncbi:hypothetical protein PM082_001002 [Marasmius tenuissimus]|nr:hypothetical protein PM082_001002 [Marasmius tenuissimus]
MSLRFQDLPEDILLRIMTFIDPIDLLRLRQVSSTISEQNFNSLLPASQTSQRLFDFTSERTLWTSFYRNSPLFLSYLTPSTLSTYSTREMERLLIHAQRMDKRWRDREFSLRHRDLPSTETIEGTRGVGIYLGRYLFVGSISMFALYDLDREDTGEWDRPMFVSKPNKVNGGPERLVYGTASAPTSNGDIYLPIYRMNKSESSLCVVLSVLAYRLLNKSTNRVLWLLQPRKNPSLVQIDQIPVSSIGTTPTAWATHQLLIYQSGSSTATPNIYDIGKKKNYRLDDQHQLPTQIQSHIYHREYVPTTHFILVFHIGAHDTVFEVFGTDPDLDSGSDVLKRTHIGTLPKGLTEPALISCRPSQLGSDPSDRSQHATLHLAAIFHYDGLQAFRAYLQNDGSIEFDLPSTSSSVHPSPAPASGIPLYTTTNRPHTEISSAFNLALTVDHRGPMARARGASLTANSSVTLLLHEIEWSEGENKVTGRALEGGRATEGARVRTTSMIVPELAYGNDFAWDALSGRLAVQSENGVVTILDLV